MYTELDLTTACVLASATIERDLPGYTLADVRLRHDDPLRANVLSREIGSNPPRYASHIMATAPCEGSLSEPCDGGCFVVDHDHKRSDQYWRTMLVWGHYGLDAADGEILTRTR